jgi:hypothetical protein
MAPSPFYAMMILWQVYLEWSLGVVKKSTKRITEPIATRPNATKSIVLIKTPYEYALYYFKAKVCSVKAQKSSV